VFASEHILGAFEVAMVIDLKKMADLWLVATDPGAAILVPTQKPYVSCSDCNSRFSNSLLIGRADCRMQPVMDTRKQ
jgi:hypothetical protein